MDVFALGLVKFTNQLSLPHFGKIYQCKRGAENFLSKPLDINYASWYNRVSVKVKKEECNMANECNFSMRIQGKHDDVEDVLKTVLSGTMTRLLTAMQVILNSLNSMVEKKNAQTLLQIFKI